MKNCRFKWLVLILAACLAWTSYSFAELYKWVDADGVVHFSDQPHKEDPNDIPIETRPSIEGKSVVKKASKQSKAPSPPPPSPSSANAPTADAPSPDYSDAEVELFVTRSCGYCTMARNYLNAKGISFMEYDVEKDSSARKRKRRLDPRRGVPLAVINGQTILGFSPAAYDAALAAPP